ncbi:MAG: hypothetical protein ABDI20_05945 [Candidatus Bipolaricaulaceae bacterium]
MNEGWVLLVEFGHPAKAHIARAALEAEDIPVLLVEGCSAWFTPHLRLYVPKEKAGEAAKILDKLPGLFRWWDEP